MPKIKKNKGEKAEEEENKLRYIEKLEAHIKTTEGAVTYSLDRFDVLVISLASGGLTLSMGFVKNMFDDFSKVDLTFLKLSWVLFSISLVVNLLSQVTGYFVNKYEIQISKNIIRIKREKDPRGNQSIKERYKSIFDILTHAFNLISLLTLIFGIILMVLFTYINL